jgi:hypothetical protein
VQRLCKVLGVSQRVYFALLIRCASKCQQREMVMLALSSGAQIASDLGIGKSTLRMWISQIRPKLIPASPQANLARKNEPLCATAPWGLRPITINAERIWPQSWPTHRQAEAAIFRSINEF